MTLSAVPDPDPDMPTFSELRDGIPTFETHLVSETRLVVRGLNQLDCDDRVLQIDDIVHFTAEARVVGVTFEVDEHSGKLVRIQKVKVLDFAIVPWDDDNPHDTGVLSGQ